MIEEISEIAEQNNDISSDSNIELNHPTELNDVENVENINEVDNPVSETEVNNEELNRVLLITRNECLEGDVHPVTGVPFERKIIEVDNGVDKEAIEGVFPQFDSEFDAQLPKELYLETDRKQFSECNNQLKERINNDPEFAKKFTDEQIEQINNNETPDGYVWHHDAEVGKMQLVDFETHANTGHTGGKNVWGGGNDYR